MKHSFVSLLIFVSATGVMATTASCSERPKQPDPKVKTVDVAPPPAVTPVPALPSATVVAIPVSSTTAVADDFFTEASATLERTSRDQAAELTPLPEQVIRSLDSSIALWKAQGGKTSPSSENKLDLARTDFAQKVRTLTLASEETWGSAKEAARSSLEQLRVAYEELRTSRKPV